MVKLIMMKYSHSIDSLFGKLDESEKRLLSPVRRELFYIFLFALKIVLLLMPVRF